jgi:hypothetical protein
MVEHDSDATSRLEQKLDRLTWMSTAQLALIGGGVAIVAPALVVPGLVIAGGAAVAVRWLPDLAQAGAASLARMSTKLQSLAGANGERQAVDGSPPAS